VKNRKVVAFHDAFPYLAKRYGLQQLGVFEEFPGKEASPKYLASLIQLVKQQGVGLLLSEPQFSPALLKRVAADTGVRTAELDTMETGEASAGFYEAVARRNLVILEKSLP
jgi:ABC-type Zn uptake system ZnuABC Zn-binding protein ZnuA